MNSIIHSAYLIWGSGYEEIVGNKGVDSLPREKGQSISLFSKVLNRFGSS